MAYSGCIKVTLTMPINSYNKMEVLRDEMGYHRSQYVSNAIRRYNKALEDQKVSGLIKSFEQLDNDKKKSFMSELKKLT